MRDAGRWSLARTDRRDPVDVDLAAVLALGAPSTPVKRPTAPAGWLRPTGPGALLVRDGTLLAASSSSGELVPLTAHDLAVLDQLDEPRSMSALAEALSGVDLAATAARLEDLRLATTEAIQPDVHAWLPPRPTRPTTFIRPGDHWLDLDPTRIPVLPAYVPTAGPPLALGLITAMARMWRGGELTDRFDLRRPVTLDEALVLLGQVQGPAVLLCSNYMWTRTANHEMARRAKELNPATVVIHGGPDTPKYDDDLLRFLHLPGVDVAVIGEGEDTACELLAALGEAPVWGDLTGLADVAGLGFLAPDGTMVRTASRDRRADLDPIPSPYLTGEFDDLHPVAWDSSFEGQVVIETNRGCPYRCTFCDWGSATMSRIRSFAMERVEAEMRWLAERQVSVWMLADANVGILARDVDIARFAAELRTATGVPTFLGINTAKNTTRHLPDILRTLFDAGVATVSSLSLQTRDLETLQAIKRSNISPERYDNLCATFRSLGLPIMCDLILGLPGATVPAFKDDLQWAFDHEITARAWLLQLLPNAPMNDPSLRRDQEIEVDEDGMVVATLSYDRADHQRMLQLRMAFRVLEHFGLLRHVLRWLQWDHDLRAIDVMERLVDWSDDCPEDAPLLSFVLRYFDYFPIPPVSWPEFYAEIRRFITEILGIPAGTALEAVLAVQVAIMPERRRSYPDHVELAHDYVAYLQEATASLDSTGRATRPTSRLHEHPPATLTISGDPAALVHRTFRRIDEQRPIDLIPGEFWQVLHYELDSPLTRFVAEVRANPGYVALSDHRRTAAAERAVTVRTHAEV